MDVDIWGFETAMVVDTTDLSYGSRGPMYLSVERDYVNRLGFQRDEFTDTNKVWGNNVGSGWTHNYNMFIRTTPNGPPPPYAVFSDERG
ncbi:MAG: hypothetical protein HY706_15050, partial [Candidatus Hydrogenedentes bacterium]|nr:hypothetical protein [Candidatus Hydrogenedentota bacterium]